MTPSSGCSWRSRGRRSKTAARSPTGWRVRPSACSSGSQPTIMPAPGAERGGAEPRATASPATAGSIAANRISHFFDFRGPSLAIDTACSSSLVAAHARVPEHLGRRVRARAGGRRRT